MVQKLFFCATTSGSAPERTVMTDPFVSTGGKPRFCHPRHLFGWGFRGHLRADVRQ